MSNSAFSILFSRSSDVYSAVRAVMSRSGNNGEVIDPNEVVRELMTHYNDISIPPAALFEEVTRAAFSAAVY